MQATLQLEKSTCGGLLTIGVLVWSSCGYHYLLWMLLVLSHTGIPTLVSASPRTSPASLRILAIQFIGPGTQSWERRCGSLGGLSPVQHISGATYASMTGPQ